MTDAFTVYTQLGDKPKLHYYRNGYFYKVKVIAKREVNLPTGAYMQWDLIFTDKKEQGRSVDKLARDLEGTLSY